MSRRKLSLAALSTLLLLACAKNEAPAAGADGARVFNAQCAICHGSAGEGSASVVGSYPNVKLADGVWAHGATDAEIEQTIRKGVAGTPMPPFAQTLTADEIQAVARYVKSLAK